MGVMWVAAASREGLRVHGDADGELSVSIMVVAAPVVSEQNETVGELDLGQVSTAGQEEWRKEVRIAGERSKKSSGTLASSSSPRQLSARQDLGLRVRDLGGCVRYG